MPLIVNYIDPEKVNFIVNRCVILYDNKFLSFHLDHMLILDDDESLPEFTNNIVKNARNSEIQVTH